MSPVALKAVVPEGRQGQLDLDAVEMVGSRGVENIGIIELT